MSWKKVIALQQKAMERAEFEGDIRQTTESAKENTYFRAKSLIFLLIWP